MTKRKWHYILPPSVYDCKCGKCGGSNLEWSEYEHHIWCYDCEEDYDITVVDIDPLKCRRASENLDVIVVEGKQQ